MSLGDVVKRKRQELQLTQDQVSARVGISKPYLSNIETEKVKNPPSEGVIRRLEQALKFPTGELRRLAHMARTPSDVRQRVENMQSEIEKLRSVLNRLASGQGRRGAPAAGRAAKKAAGNASQIVSAGRAVPIINRVAAGYPHHFTDLDYPPGVADEYVRTPDVHDAQAFAARVVGDSMSPRYNEGDIVVFVPNAAPKDGDDCFIRFSEDNSTTFKRYFAGKGGRIRLQPLNKKYPTEEYGPDDISGLWPALMRIERVRK
jgi:SOS-response transcriptional repressor LexA